MKKEKQYLSLENVELSYFGELGHTLLNLELINMSEIFKSVGTAMIDVFNAGICDLKTAAFEVSPQTEAAFEEVSVLNYDDMNKKDERISVSGRVAFVRELIINESENKDYLSSAIEEIIVFLNEALSVDYIIIQAISDTKSIPFEQIKTKKEEMVSFYGGFGFELTGDSIGTYMVRKLNTSNLSEMKSEDEATSNSRTNKSSIPVDELGYMDEEILCEIKKVSYYSDNNELDLWVGQMGDERVSKQEIYSCQLESVQEKAKAIIMLLLKRVQQEVLDKEIVENDYSEDIELVAIATEENGESVVSLSGSHVKFPEDMLFRLEYRSCDNEVIFNEDDSLMEEKDALLIFEKCFESLKKSSEHVQKAEEEKVIEVSIAG